MQPVHRYNLQPGDRFRFAPDSSPQYQVADVIEPPHGGARQVYCRHLGEKSVRTWLLAQGPQVYVLGGAK